MLTAKICGITDPESLKAAIKSGAGWIGLVFYPPSSRYVELEMAQVLSGLAPDEIEVVGVFVNPTDDEVLYACKYAYLDFVQLHGDETPQRVKEIKELTGAMVIKSFAVASETDLDSVKEYEDCADWLLFDTKVSDGGVSGGTGRSFDWNILKEKEFSCPWILSGGLNADNILDALEIVNPDVIDLSSGVEEHPGKKSPKKIQEFFDLLKQSGKFRPSYLRGC